MTSSSSGKQGETLSHKNACKEFGLAENEILDAIRQNKIQYIKSYAHGNPYFKLFRDEVKALALELRGSTYLEEQEIDFRLNKVTSEIRSLKLKLAKLEKEKLKLLKAKEAFKA